MITLPGLLAALRAAHPACIAGNIRDWENRG